MSRNAIPTSLLNLPRTRTRRRGAQQRENEYMGPTAVRYFMPTTPQEMLRTDDLSGMTPLQMGVAAGLPMKDIVESQVRPLRAVNARPPQPLPQVNPWGGAVKRRMAQDFIDMQNATPNPMTPEQAGRLDYERSLVPSASYADMLAHEASMQTGAMPGPNRDWTQSPYEQARLTAAMAARDAAREAAYLESKAASAAKAAARPTSGTQKIARGEATKADRNKLPQLSPEWELQHAERQAKQAQRKEDARMLRALTKQGLPISKAEGMLPGLKNLKNREPLDTDMVRNLYGPEAAATKMEYDLKSDPVWQHNQMLAQAAAGGATPEALQFLASRGSDADTQSRFGDPDVDEAFNSLPVEVQPTAEQLRIDGDWAGLQKLETAYNLAPGSLTKGLDVPWYKNPQNFAGTIGAILGGPAGSIIGNIGSHLLPESSQAPTVPEGTTMPSGAPQPLLPLATGETGLSASVYPDTILENARFWSNAFAGNPAGVVAPIVTDYLWRRSKKSTARK